VPGLGEKPLGFSKGTNRDGACFYWVTGDARECAAPQWAHDTVRDLDWCECLLVIVPFPYPHAGQVRKQHTLGGQPKSDHPPQLHR